MVTNDLRRLKPETRRRAWRLFRIILDVYRRAPERVPTLERLLEAYAVGIPQDGSPRRSSVKVL